MKNMWILIKIKYNLIQLEQTKERDQFLQRTTPTNIVCIRKSQDREKLPKYAPIFIAVNKPILNESSSELLILEYFFVSFLFWSI